MIKRFAKVFVQTTIVMFIVDVTIVFVESYGYTRKDSLQILTLIALIGFVCGMMYVNRMENRNVKDKQ